MKTPLPLFPFVLLMLYCCGEEESSNKDTTNLSLTILSPESQSIVQDDVILQCETNNDDLVLKIELWIDGDSTEICDYVAPFELTWNTINYDNGNHELFVRMYDENGNKYDSETIILKVNNFLIYSTTYGLENISEIGSSILQLEDSSFVILGSEENNVLLLKTNRYGQIEWNQSFGGDDYSDIATHFQNTSDGGYILSGTTISYGYGGSDIWLIKMNQNGMMEWNTTFGSAGDEIGGQVIETIDGGYLVIGNIDTQENGANNIWLIKTNSQGDSLWTRKYGGSEFDQGTDIILDDDNGYVILGSTKSFGNGASDIWIIKADSSGNQEWTNTYGNGGNDFGQSILKTYDGGYIVRYIIESFGDGNTAVGLLKINQNGQEIWTKTIGGSIGTAGNSFYRISDDEYIMACSLFDNGENSYNAYIIKISDSGDILWDRTFGGNEDDRARSILQTKDGGYIIVGSTNNLGNGDKNSSDLWIIKTNSEGHTINFNYSMHD